MYENKSFHIMNKCWRSRTIWR